MCFQDLCLNIRTVFAFGDRTKIHLVRPDWSLVSSPGAKLTKKYLQIISNIFCTTRCCRNCFCVLEFCLTHIMSGMMKLTNPRKIAFVNTEKWWQKWPTTTTLKQTQFASIWNQFACWGGANLREYVSHWELWTSTIKATICSSVCVYIYTVYTYVCVAFAMLIRNAIIPDHFALCGESSSDLRNGRADEPDETAKIHWPAEEIPPWVQLFGQGRGCGDESSTMLNTDSTHPKTKDYSCRSLYHEPFCSTRPDPEPVVKQPMYQ